MRDFLIEINDQKRWKGPQQHKKEQQNGLKSFLKKYESYSEKTNGFANCALFFILLLLIIVVVFNLSSWNLSVEWMASIFLD